MRSANRRNRKIIDRACSAIASVGRPLGATKPSLIESLESRQLLSAVLLSGTGNLASVTAVRDAFRAQLGGGTVAGANGSFGGVRREINWDGVPAAFADPNALPTNFFNVNSPRGVVFSTPGTGFEVSSNPADAATAGQPAPANFGDIDPTYSTAFSTFSPTRLFTPIGSNVTDVNFFLPGTTTPATTNGFGAVFTDVDTANTTSIEFFDASNNSLGVFFAQPTAGDGSLSFVGVSFDNREQVSRVRITTGTAALGADDVTQNASNGDVVAMDDFIYGEPGQFTVINTNDAGAGSLRQALLNANAVPGKHLIDFAISGVGPQKITLASDLPASTGPIVVDGYTQSGSSPNTLAVGDDAALNVEIDASGFRGFQLQGGNSTIRGLVMNDYHNAAVDIQSGANSVTGNFLGTDPTGTLSRRNPTGGTAPIGVNVTSGTDNVIGGTDPADRNLISANFDGIASYNAGSAFRTTILGNYIGTDHTGMVAIPNSDAGILLVASTKSSFTIGGTAAGAGNVVSGNGILGGIEFNNSGGNNRLIANLIGTAADGVSPLGNSGKGVTIFGTPNTVVGGLNGADGNVIAFNADRGVNVGFLNDSASVGDAILSNSIFSNGGLGIDLGLEGVTPNDPADGDTGPNNFQNFPAIVSAVSNGTTTAISGAINSNPNSLELIQFFAGGTAGDAGQTLLGQTTVLTDASGNALFTFNTINNVPAGQFITATATNLTTLPFGDTSEFAIPISVIATPPKISVSDVSLTEGNSGNKNFVFTVSLDHATNVPVTVHFKTVDGSAKSTSDYTARNNTLTIPAGSTSGTVTVQVHGDTTVEATENFFLKLDSPTNATIADNSGTGTIINDDSTSLPKLSISGFGAAEGNSGSKTFTFKVTLNQISGNTVTVKYATSNGTASSGSDYASKSGTVTFNPGETVKTVSVTVFGDHLHEADETFFVKLSNAVNATISVGTGKGTIKNDD
jgi:hypothetical protein